ncbi:hypothetical protein CH063_10326 [Colletotrichum higginsianum]|uniref:Uncharacterized protein n=1 Tax=Colletotrichum higginsianum (strain IMI 349063) TaxID=759273 RepID=H1VH09_COLHI|nr:hypothetical protein CH063_10326 [Colletotrichum higginsianum]
MMQPPCDLRRLLNLTSAGPPPPPNKALGLPETPPTFLHPSKTISPTCLRSGGNPWLVAHPSFLLEMQDNDYLQHQPLRPLPTVGRLQLRRKNRRKTGWHDVSPPHCLHPMSIASPLIGCRCSQRQERDPVVNATPPADGCGNLHRYNHRVRAGQLNKPINFPLARTVTGFGSGPAHASSLAVWAG